MLWDIYIEGLLNSGWVGMNPTKFKKLFPKWAHSIKWRYHTSTLEFDNCDFTTNQEAVVLRYHTRLGYYHFSSLCNAVIVKIRTFFYFISTSQRNGFVLTPWKLTFSILAINAMWWPLNSHFQCIFQPPLLTWRWPWLTHVNL